MNLADWDQFRAKNGHRAVLIQYVDCLGLNVLRAILDRLPAAEQMTTLNQHRARLIRESGAPPRALFAHR